MYWRPVRWRRRVRPYWRVGWPIAAGPLRFLPATAMLCAPIGRDGVIAFGYEDEEQGDVLFLQ